MENYGNALIVDKVLWTRLLLIDFWRRVLWLKLPCVEI